MTTHQSTFLSAHAQKTDSVEKAIPLDHYDFAFFFSSWDSRCIEITAAKTKLGISVLTLFDSKDKFSLRDRHDKALVEYCSQNSGRTVLVNGVSLDPPAIERQFIAAIKQSGAKGRFLNVLIDMSAAPKYYILFLLGLLFRNGLAIRVTFFYAEGDYSSVPMNTEEKGLDFTKGAWKTIAVSTLQGVFRPEGEKFILTSIGFEGSKIYKTLKAEDPDRIGILFPKPGVLPGHEARTTDANKLLLSEVSEGYTFYAHAADAIQTWATISKASFWDDDAINTYLLCGGSKPHALGLGLCALDKKTPTVLYNLPESHIVNKITPVGLYWTYIVEDRSAL